MNGNMDIVSRELLETISKSLGRAYLYIINQVGDTNKSPKSRWELETAFIKLRNSTLFHDDDTASLIIPENTYYGFKTYAPLRYNVKDPIGYGIQGENIIGGIGTQLEWYSPTSIQNWNPSLYGPPSPQGWFNTNNTWYSSWIGNLIIDQSNPNLRAWQSYPYEPIGVNSTIGNRNDLLYPSRWNGESYDRIPLWKSARWISLFNDGYNILPNTTVTCIIDKSDLIGCELIDSENGLPLDFAIYTHPDLVQSHNNGQWQPVTKLPNNSDTFGYIPYNISCYDDKSFLLKINIPDSLNLYLGTTVSMGSTFWTNQCWWHLVIYYGSNDPLSISISNSSKSAYVDTPSIYPDILVWQRKNFFDKSLIDRIQHDTTYIQERNSFLVSNNRYHFVLYDGQYLDKIPPYKYTLPASWKFVSWDVPDDVFDNIMDMDCSSGGVFPAILCCFTSGELYHDCVQTLVLIGPQVTPEFYPNSWEECNYFPIVPFGYTEIARCVLRRATDTHYDIPSYGYSFDVLDSIQNKVVGVKFDIIWMHQSAENFAIPPICDESLSTEILPKLGSFVQRYRNINAQKPIVDASFVLIGKASGLPNSVAANIGALSDPRNISSQIFLGNLKHPLYAQLQGTPDAIPFDNGGRRVISELAGLPPSTEIMKLDTNEFYLTGEKLHSPNKFEIYQEVFGACSYIDPNVTGTGVAKDYCFRMELIDDNENSFYKDWFVMASNYLISEEEKSYKLLTGESINKYYTQSDYKKIGDWNKYGYAAIVPDLSMGKSIIMQNKVVSPSKDENGNDVITEEMFRQDLKNKGYTNEQIDDMVAQYIEEHGQFPVIDTRSYPNLFTHINDASMSITEYTDASVPYWYENISNYYYNSVSLSNYWNQYSVNNLYADSFTLATGGLAPGELESFGNTEKSIYTMNTHGTHINFTESYRAFRLLDDSSDLNSANMGAIGIGLRYEPYTESLDIGNNNQILLYDNYYAICVTPSEDINLGGIGVQLRLDGNISNPEDYISSYLYSYKDGFSVGSRIATGNIIKYGSISTYYSEHIFGFDFEQESNQVLFSNVHYWLVIKQSNNPQGANIEINRMDFSENDSYIGIGTDIYSNFYYTDVNQTWYRLIPKYNDNNPDINIRLSLWTEIGVGNSVLPNYIVATSPTTIHASQLTANFREYKFDLPFNLYGYYKNSNTRLWAVLEKNIDPLVGAIQIDAGYSSRNIASNAYKLSTNTLSKYKTPVSVASTSIDFSYTYDSVTQKLTISNLPITIDGVNIEVGYRILLKDFDNTHLNGIYVLTSDQKLTRDTDFNKSNVVHYGELIKVTGGVTNKNKTFRIISPDPILIDYNTNAGDIIFQEFIDNTWLRDTQHSNQNIWYSIYTTSPQVVGSFNRQDSAILQQLPPPNTCRHQINNNLLIDGFWNFSLKKFDTPKELKIYPRAVWDYTSGFPPTIFKARARVATTNNIEIYSFDTNLNLLMTNGAVSAIDGIQLQIGDRVLLKDMNQSLFNGVYSVVGIGSTSTVMVRSDDFNSTDNIIHGAVIGVEEGNVNTNTQWIVSSYDPHIVNVSDIVLNQYVSQYRYVPNTKDIHTIIRTVVGDKIINRFVLIPAGNTQELDVTNGVPVDGIVWMAIGKGDDLMAASVATTSINDIQLIGYSNNTIEHANLPTHIDGVELKHGDRVLIKNYPINGIGTVDPKYNGVYRYIDPVVEYSTDEKRAENNNKRFVRTSDFCDVDQITNGMTIRVMHGHTQSNTFWGLNVNVGDPIDIILNETPLIFTQIEPKMSNDVSAPWFGGNPTDNLSIRST